MSTTVTRKLPLALFALVVAATAALAIGGFSPSGAAEKDDTPKPSITSTGWDCFYGLCTCYSEDDCDELKEEEPLCEDFVEEPSGAGSCVIVDDIVFHPDVDPPGSDPTTPEEDPLRRPVPPGDDSGSVSDREPGTSGPPSPRPDRDLPVNPVDPNQPADPRQPGGSAGTDNTTDPGREPVSLPPSAVTTPDDAPAMGL